MIVFIDRSRHWNGRRTEVDEWIRLLEAFFRDRPERRPASGLEVFMLSRARIVPRRRSSASVRGIRGPARAGYSDNMPA